MSSSYFSFRNWFPFWEKKYAKDLDTERITEIATEVNNQFVKDYALWFKECLHEQVKAEGKDAEKSKTQFQLLPAPLSSRKIKKGFLRKIGNNVKNWKNRYFVAFNQADNYAIVYYEDESMTKEKGRIYCCGYMVETFNREEEKQHGTFGFKLSHPDDTKRIWYLRAENYKDHHEWMQVFSHACKRAVSNPDEPELYRKSFECALRSTRSAYGYFGLCEVFASKEEMLLLLTNLILHREVLDEYFQTKAKTSRTQSVAGKVRSKSTSLLPTRQHSQDYSNAYNFSQYPSNQSLQTVRQTVQNIVLPIVASSMRTMQSEAQSLSHSYPNVVKKNRHVLLDKEKKISAFLDKSMSQLVAGLESELRYDICQTLIDRVFQPLSTSYLMAVQAFAIQTITVLLPYIGEEQNNGQQFKTEVKVVLEKLEEEVENVGDLDSHLLENSYKILWRMQSEQLLELEELLHASNLSAYSLYVNCVQDLQTLLRNAIFTLHQYFFHHLPVPVPVPSDSLHAHGEKERDKSLIFGHEISILSSSDIDSVKIEMEMAPSDAAEGMEEEEGDEEEDEEEYKRLAKKREKFEVLKAKMAAEHGSNTEEDYVSLEAMDGEIAKSQNARKSHQFSSSKPKQKKKSITNNNKQSMFQITRNESVTQVPPSPSADFKSVDMAYGPIFYLSAPSAFSELMKDIIYFMEKDCLLIYHERLVHILLDTMEGKVQELLISPAVDRAFSAEHMLSHCPVEISLACLGERMVRDKVKRLVVKMLKSYMEKLKEKLKEMSIWNKLKDMLA